MKVIVYISVFGFGFGEITMNKALELQPKDITMVGGGLPSATECLIASAIGFIAAIGINRCLYYKIGYHHKYKSRLPCHNHSHKWLIASPNGSVLNTDLL